MSDTHTERDSKSPAANDNKEQTALDLSGLPTIFVIGTHMPSATLHAVEDALVRHGAPLTNDAKEAGLFLCSLHTKRRVGVELRSVAVWTEELPEAEQLGYTSGKRLADAAQTRPAKRQKSEAAGTATRSTHMKQDGEEEQVLRALRLAVADDNVVVLKHRWLTDALARRRIVPPAPYTIYQGRRMHTPKVQGEASAPALATRPGETREQA
jgi:hypothetical protein